MSYNIAKKSESNLKKTSGGLTLLISGYMSHIFSIFLFNVIVNSHFGVLRLEQDATAKDALLISEKQTHEATKKTLTETLGRNEELIKKIQDSDKHSLQLQLTVERLIIILGSMFLF
jgi:hypothetical protein